MLRHLMSEGVGYTDRTGQPYRVFVYTHERSEEIFILKYDLIHGAAS